MTDEKPWQAPGAAAPSSSQPAPPSADSARLQPPPGYYAPPVADAGWTPPPKPGLIPLRPLDFGTLLGASFRVLRRNPRPTFGIALLIQAAAMILSLVLVGVLTFASVSRINSATAEDESTILAGTVGISVVSTLITVLFSLVATAILQGIIVVEVARGSLGEKLPLRRLWGFAKGKIWALVGWAVIIGGVMLVAIGIVVGLIVLMTATMGAFGAGLSVIFSLLAFAGFAVLGVWLGTKLSLVPSALVLEQVSLRKAIFRSWSLTQGHFWKVFGVQLLVSSILSIASYFIIIPLALVAGIILALVDPTGAGGTTSMIWALVAYVVYIMATIVVATIMAIVVTATSSLLYLDLRMRKEGLDLQLTRFVESRQVGADDTANPYLRADEQPVASASGYTFA